MSERPDWLRVRVPTPAEAEGMAALRAVLGRHALTTVCQGAVCPNAVECWSARTATFMILGDTCTRACRFCAVTTGNPAGAVDRGEPARVALAVEELGLSYVVLTSVDRDDLGLVAAELFAETVERIKSSSESIGVELLVPDFGGDPEAVEIIARSRADVLGHNIETVRRLSPRLRDPRAGYGQSLQVLEQLRACGGGAPVKSGLMLGLGETAEEVRNTLADLHSAGVEIVTMGQYLRPTPASVPVERYVPPDEFEKLAIIGRDLGFASVIAGPRVRSSYHAEQAFRERCA